MSTSTLRARSGLHRAALTTLAVLTATAAALVTPPAASDTDLSCPTTVPATDIVDGMAVHGLTVSEGTTPEPFTGEVIGVLDDGIAPGLDMIMVKLTSPAIDDVGGIWAGISGSPVYMEGTDRLIGAVSYGLSWGTSPIAGVTPAEEMYKLLKEAPTSSAAAGTIAAAAEPEPVPIPSRLAKSLVAEGHATEAQAASELVQLPMPLSVSGLSKGRYAQFAERMTKRQPGIDLRRATAGGASTAADVPIVAGGNLAATISYGDLTYGGLGTATAVCGDEVLGFGHPMIFSGKSTLTMHGAEALFVQSDPTWGSFKVGNFGAPTGTIYEDRLAAIAGEIGTLPPATAVRSRAATTDGRARVGHTTISLPDEVPWLVPWAVMANEDRVFDAWAPGTARLRWIVKGTRQNGTPFVLDRVDRYMSPWDITFSNVWDLESQLAAIQFFEHEKPTITHVDVRALLDDTPRAFTVRGVQVRKAGSWRRVRPGGVVRQKAGTTLRLRIRASSYRNLAGTKRIRVGMVMPRRHAGKVGFLALRGGDSGEFWGSPNAATLPQLLRKLDSQQRNDQLVMRLSRNRWSRATWRAKAPIVHDVLRGGFRMRVRIVR